MRSDHALVLRFPESPLMRRRRLAAQILAGWFEAHSLEAAQRRLFWAACATSASLISLWHALTLLFV